MALGMKNTTSPWINKRKNRAVVPRYDALKAIKMKAAFSPTRYRLVCA